VIDSPPLNLFRGDLLADLRAAVDEAADSDIRALRVRAEGDDSPEAHRSRSSSGFGEAKSQLADDPGSKPGSS
jgi:enoyl-CoA hydratase/carnithine racemase